MRTKGVGPRNLGVSPLKAKSDPPVPGKALVQGYRDYAANKNNTRYNPDAFANREKATGGIKLDNTIESLFVGGPAAKGVVKGLSIGGRKLLGAAAAGARTARAAHLGTEVAHIGEVAHSAVHMRKAKK
jgi:hypothetical protein